MKSSGPYIAPHDLNIVLWLAKKDPGLEWGLMADRYGGHISFEACLDTGVAP